MAIIRIENPCKESGGSRYHLNALYSCNSYLLYLSTNPILSFTEVAGAFACFFSPTDAYFKLFGSKAGYAHPVNEAIDSGCKVGSGVCFLDAELTTYFRNTIIAGTKTDMWRVDCIGEALLKHVVR